MTQRELSDTVENLMTFVTAIAYVIGTIGMVVWGHMTDRMLHPRRDGRRQRMTAPHHPELT